MISTSNDPKNYNCLVGLPCFQDLIGYYCLPIHKVIVRLN